jgi:predicted MPP superfamily phosphohydrolase
MLCMVNRLMHRMALPIGLAFAMSPLVLSAYATLAEPFRPVLRRQGIVVPSRWPALSILHLSDLHVRNGADRLWHAQARLLRGLEPDLLVVTGDVCETPKDVERAIDLLSEVRPHIGTFAVLGNHEHNAHRPHGPGRAAPPAWARVVSRLLQFVAPELEHEPGQAGTIARKLADARIHVLVNEGAHLEVRGRSLWIAGCDSAWSGSADMAASMHGRRAGEPALTLVHEPELAFSAHASGADLILAGHTHGGQVRLPLIGAPYSHRNDQRLQIASGFQRIGSTLLHISAGLGHTIPLRFGCPPEAVWLDCFPAAAEATVHQQPLALAA